MFIEFIELSSKSLHASVIARKVTTRQGYENRVMHTSIIFVIRPETIVSSQHINVNNNKTVH